MICFHSFHVGSSFIKLNRILIGDYNILASVLNRSSRQDSELFSGKEGSLSWFHVAILTDSGFILNRAIFEATTIAL